MSTDPHPHPRRTTDGLPRPPQLSATTRAVLATMRTRDDALYAETGGCLTDLHDTYRRMTRDHRAALILDGFRWRHYWADEQTAYRWQCEERARRWLMVESSHDIARMIGRVGPSYTELRGRRHLPPDDDFGRWVRWETPAQPGGSRVTDTETPPENGGYPGGPVPWRNHEPEQAAEEAA
jgi:hypothetical protein